MKKKFYLTLDTETATLPFASQLCKSAEQKKQVAIAKPLVYDIGWVITDRQGNVVKSVDYLVQETFFVPNVFNTAYYREKRPLYMAMLERGEIKIATWDTIMTALLEDLRTVDICTAYNAQFDFKRAIPFTERYIKHLYSADYNEWERKQYKKCQDIVRGKKPGNSPDYMVPVFKLRGEEFPFADLWWIACDRLINIDKYRDYCLKNALLTASAQFFKSSAETTFQYLMRQYDFIEDHTALSDALIESQVLTKALKKGKVEAGLEAFPFRRLGTTFDYVTEKRPRYKSTVAEALSNYLDEKGGWDDDSRYWTRMRKTFDALIVED